MATKYYGIKDNWTDDDVANVIEVASEDGSVSSVKVNGVEYGGGGGNFSVAVVEITSAVDINIIGPITVSEDPIYGTTSYASMSVRPNHSDTFNVIMYKGKAILFIDGDDPFENTTLNGSLELIDDDYEIAVTGDGSITITA